MSTDPRKDYPFIEWWRWDWTHGTEYLGTPVVALHYALTPATNMIPPDARIVRGDWPQT
jgi:hypothetical protein